MNDIAAWVAPAATVIAAVMTAANLGARITGWGFVVFTVGSVCWCIIAVETGEQNLLFTNGFLTLVNALGIWRWLGRQSRYEEGGAAAARRGAIAPVRTLVAVGSISGRKLIGRNGDQIGEIVDGMMRCSDNGLAYIVVSEGGFGGVGERLYAIDPNELTFGDDGARWRFGLKQLQARPVIEAGAWPKSLGSGNQS